jgi:hypothetical protein
MSPGGGETATITLRNTGERSLLLKLYLADSNFGPDGAEQDLPLGTLERSCAPWLTLEGPLVELAAGGSRTVALRFAVPSEARGSYWTKLYVEEMSQPEPVKKEVEGRRYQVYIKQRMGVRVFADLPGTAEREAIVKKVTVTTGPKGRLITMRVVNPGRMLLRCQGRIELRDARGMIAQVLKVGSNGEFLVFPGAERELSVQDAVPLSAGTYTALALVDYGGEQLVAGEELFKVAETGPMLVREEKPARKAARR